jgi:hypothetical protein
MPYCQLYGGIFSRRWSDDTITVTSALFSYANGDACAMGDDE